MLNVNAFHSAHRFLLIEEDYAHYKNISSSSSRILDFLYLQPRKLYVFRNEDGFPLRTLLLVTSYTERVSKLVAMGISCILVHMTG